MSLVFALGAPGLCDLVRQAFEAARAAEEAQRRVENGENVADFQQ